MALPTNYPLGESRLNCHSSSIGGTPIIAYQAAPTRAKIIKFGAIANGVITTADCTVTVKNGATTIGTITIPVASAAAGQLATSTPTTTVLAQVSEDDIISFTPAGASGASIAGTFFAVYLQN